MNSLKIFKEMLNLEKERQLATQELSQLLGIDISFSDEEVIKNAEEQTVKHIEKKLAEKINNMVK
jgi:DNA-binding ferritin-like protein (Dps family)